MWPWKNFTTVSLHLFIAWAKIPEPRGGASHHPAFMDSCRISSHTFFALSTQWMSSPSRKWGRGVNRILSILSILSYYIYAWCDSGELGARNSLKFPCVTLVVETSSDKVHLELHQTSTIDLVCEKSQQPYHIDCLYKKVPPQTSDLIPNADLTGGGVNVGCGWTANAQNS